MKKRVLAVGDVNIDIVMTGLTDLPGPEQEVLGQNLKIMVGGQTGTVARTLSSLGLPVLFVGKVGDDEYGRQVLERLKAAGVDTTGITIDPEAQTGVTVVLSTGRERAYATYLGSIARLGEADVKPEWLHKANHIHVGSYYLQQNLRPSLGALFKKAKQLGLTTSLDPGWDPSQAWGSEIFETLAWVDVFMPNEVEATRIARVHKPEQALEVLSEYARIVVIKQGSHGCLAKDPQKRVVCPGFEVPVVDVTSAGDMFSAGLIYAFLEDWDLEMAGRFANACGAMAVTRVGSLGSLSFQEVETFLATRRE